MIEWLISAGLHGQIRPICYVPFKTAKNDQEVGSVIDAPQLSIPSYGFSVTARDSSKEFGCVFAIKPRVELVGKRKFFHWLRYQLQEPLLV